MNVDFFFFFYAFVWVCRIQSTTASTQVPQVPQVPAMPAQRLIGCGIHQGQKCPGSGQSQTMAAPPTPSRPYRLKIEARGGLKGPAEGGGFVAVVVWASLVQAAQAEGETAGDGRLYESGIWIFYTELALTASRG